MEEQEKQIGEKCWESCKDWLCVTDGSCHCWESWVHLYSCSGFISITSGHTLRIYSSSIPWSILHYHKLTLSNCPGIHVPTSWGSLNTGQLRKKHGVKGGITRHLFLFNQFNYSSLKLCRSTSVLTATCHLGCAMSLAARHDHVHREWDPKDGNVHKVTLTHQHCKTGSSNRKLSSIQKRISRKKLSIEVFAILLLLFLIQFYFFPFHFMWGIPLHCSGWSATDSQGWYPFHLEYLISDPINWSVSGIPPLTSFRPLLSTNPSPFVRNSLHSWDPKAEAGIWLLPHKTLSTAKGMIPDSIVSPSVQTL